MRMMRRIQTSSMHTSQGKAAPARPQRGPTRVYDVEVTRIRTGQADEARSEDRLEALYSSHGAAATRLAYVLTGDRHIAEDIAHEAFVKIGRKLFGLRDSQHERAYLLRTVINLCRGHGRKLRSERSAMTRVQEQTVGRSATDQGDSAIWEAVKALPPRQRAALFLRYYQDLSEAQAAEVLDCSVSAMKSLVNRALNELREQTTRSET